MRQEAAGQPPIAAPQPMGGAMEEQNMHTRVCQKHLGVGPRSRVAGHNRIEMLANALENHDRRRGKVSFCPRGPTGRPWMVEEDIIIPTGIVKINTKALGGFGI